jgi:hypothetical protein
MTTDQNEPYEVRQARASLGQALNNPSQQLFHAIRKDKVTITGFN